MQAHERKLTQALISLEDGCLLVVTGAGISQASGIPTFRGSDPGAVWRSSDVSLATHEYFQRDPVGQWRWYLKRFESVRDARPNAAHLALVRLESWIEKRGGSFLLVTQNIDTLHETAGTRNLIKVHGTSDRVRCSRNGCGLGAPTGSLTLAEVDFSPFDSRQIEKNLPTCPECGAVLRAHVLFFDEFYLEHVDYRFVEAERAADQADVILFIGTSFSVGVTDLFLQAGARRGVPMFSIDPASTATPWPGLTLLPAPAENLLPTVCDQLDQL